MGASKTNAARPPRAGLYALLSASGTRAGNATLRRLRQLLWAMHAAQGGRQVLPSEQPPPKSLIPLGLYFLPEAFNLILNLRVFLLQLDMVLRQPLDPLLSL
jgi:hypothetical protein